VLVYQDSTYGCLPARLSWSTDRGRRGMSLYSRLAREPWNLMGVLSPGLRVPTKRPSSSMRLRTKPAATFMLDLCEARVTLRISSEVPSLRSSSVKSNRAHW